MFRISRSVIALKCNKISINWRQLSTEYSESKQWTEDCVSPSHSVSNLRLIKFGKHRNETESEKRLRSERIKLQEWNHNYWLKNNTEFQKQKTEYIENELKGMRDREFKSTLSYDELGVFYKRFLDTNHRKHMEYNLEWYKRHTSLLWPGFKVFLIRLKRNLFQTK